MTMAVSTFSVVIRYARPVMIHLNQTCSVIRQKQDLFKKDNHTVSGVEVEKDILRHPDIVDAAVIPVKL